MRLTLLCTLPDDHVATRHWIRSGVRSLGHHLQDVDRPSLPPARAADLGYAVARSWRGTPPDAVLALGLEAGLAAQVATREHPAPVLLRLRRPGRSGDPALTRVERALCRSATTVLATAPSEAEALADLGARRPRIRVLPEAVDVAAAAVPDDAPAVVLAEDDDGPQVAAVLSGMAAGRPAVVRDLGVLGDLVADGVTGLVVPSRGDLSSAARRLQADALGREAMGLAAADRAAACFDVGVVVPALGRLLDELREPATLSA